MSIDKSLWKRRIATYRLQQYFLCCATCRFCEPGYYSELLCDHSQYGELVQGHGICDVYEPSEDIPLAPPADSDRKD